MQRDILKSLGLLVLGALVYWLVTRNFHLQELLARGAYVRVDAERRPYLLALQGQNFTNRDLSLLHTIPTIERLSVRESRVDDDGIAPLSRLPKLLELDLSGTEVTDAALLQLAEIPTLETLELDGCGGVSAAGLANLGRLGRLTRLSVRDVPLTYPEYCELQNEFETVEIRADPESLLQLTPHDVWNASWFEEPHRNCGTIRLVTRPEVRRVTVDDLSAIEWPEAVASMSFGTGTAVEEGVLELLSSFPKLQSLSIAAPIDDDDFAIVCRLPELRALRISSSTITDAGLESIPEDAPLRALKLRTNGISSAGLEAVSRLSRLEELDLSHQPLNGEMLAQLGHLEALTSLMLIECGLQDRDLPFLGELKTLQYVDLRSNPLTTLPTETIQALPDLRSLDLRNTRIPLSDTDAIDPSVRQRLIAAPDRLLLRFWYDGFVEYEAPLDATTMPGPYRMPAADR